MRLKTREALGLIAQRYKGDFYKGLLVDRRELQVENVLTQHH
jgi:hypothetical protein